jgi:hypothetical protein
MAIMSVTVLSHDGEAHEVCAGDSGQCPPIPRIGETIQRGNDSAVVKDVIHMYDDAPTIRGVVRIAILVKPFFPET